MKFRKTRHDYWNYPQQTQENYLNIRYQFSYLEAGYHLKFIQDMMDFGKIMFTIEICNRAIGIATQSLKEAKII